MTRKYRNGKASGEPKRDLKYSPEYLAYRQSRGGESVKVSQCDLDLDGTADSIVSAWRHPAVGKSEHCGDPYLFWPVTGISTLLNPHSPPTGIQTHASPQGDQAPTGIGLEIDMDEDGFYAGPNNLPPYDFDDNDDTVGAITLLNSVDQGPTGISTIAPLQNANSGPTGISLQIDMDEDGVYAGPNNLPPYDFDDNDDTVGAITLLNSADQGPTGISTIAPLQNANSGPTGISLQIDMDEDGVYAPADFDDNDSGIKYQQGIAIVGATFRSPSGYQPPLANGRSGRMVTGRIVNTPNLGSLPKTFTIDANTSYNGDYFAGWQDHQDQTLIHNPELAVTTVTANWQRSSLALSPNAYDGAWPSSSFDTSFLFSSEKLARFVTGSDKCTVYIKLINFADKTDLPWPHNGNYPFIATAEGGSFASEKHFGSNSLVRVHVYTTVNFIISGQIVTGTFEGWNKTNSNNNAFTSKLDYYDNGFNPVSFPNFRDVHFITNADSKSIYLEPMYSIT